MQQARTLSSDVGIGVGSYSLLIIRMQEVPDSIAGLAYLIKTPDLEGESLLYRFPIGTATSNIQPIPSSVSIIHQ